MNLRSVLEIEPKIQLRHEANSVFHIQRKGVLYIAALFPSDGNKTK